MATDLTALNVTQLETITGKDRRSIRSSLAKAGVQPLGEGREKFYPSRPALEAIYTRGDELDLSAERARLAKEQADAQELKNAESRGELLRGEAVELWLVRLLGAITQRIRAIAPKAAPETRATASDAEGEALLARFHDEALQEIADALREPVQVVRGLRSRAASVGDGGGGLGSGAAPEADAKRVGGRRKKAEPRE